MALLDDVRARYSSQILKNASNPQNSTATTEDSGREAAAVSDVQAAFEVLAGVEYDSSDDRHVLYGTEGVLVRLLVMTGQSDKSEWKDWKKELKTELARVTGRDRIVPSTNSTLEVTPDSPGEKPQADRSVFDRNFIPGAPNSSNGRSEGSIQ